VLLSVQILTPLFSLTVQNFVVFFRFFDQKCNEDSKNVLQTIIFSLLVGLTGDFIFNFPFKLAVQNLTPLFSLTVPIFVAFFQVIG